MSKRPKTLFENTTRWTVPSRTPRERIRLSAPSTMRGSSTTGEPCETTGPPLRRPSSSTRPETRDQEVAPRNPRKLSTRNSVYAKSALVGESLYIFIITLNSVVGHGLIVRKSFFSALGCQFDTVYLVTEAIVILTAVDVC